MPGSAAARTPATTWPGEFEPGAGSADADARRGVRDSPWGGRRVGQAIAIIGVLRHQVQTRLPLMRRHFGRGGSMGALSASGFCCNWVPAPGTGESVSSSTIFP